MRHETLEQTEARLLEVIASAEFQVMPDLYGFEEMPTGPRGTRADAIACIRDGERWSHLVLAPEKGLFKVFSFHFDPKFDATGFVGWLHSHLARATGTGHIVVCGKDSRNVAGFDDVRGGIFDYWGCPADRADTVLAEVRALIERGL
jgi:hypothetical protein